jgi:small-conductance mechanosensitive channel
MLISFFRPGPKTTKALLLTTLAGLAYALYYEKFATLEAFLTDDRFTLKIKDYSLNPYDILTNVFLVLIIVWTTALIANYVDSRIFKIKKMRAATRALISKIIQIILYAFSLILILNLIGVDLTALTVFGGAAGIGIGFGLQKTASNFISGLILLFEKTIETGNLIELNDGTMGFVKKTSARYTLIETFDSKEMIVPNEDLMTTKVINHTYSNKTGRIDVSVGVSYKSDIHLVKKLILESAHEYKDCISKPEPQCFLTNFGDSSVDFELHFWISDVTKGRFFPKSEVLFTIWDKLKANGVEIPFPQRDLHLKSDVIVDLQNKLSKSNETQST